MLTETISASSPTSPAETRMFLSLALITNPFVSVSVHLGVRAKQDHEIWTRISLWRWKTAANTDKQHKKTAMPAVSAQDASMFCTLLCLAAMKHSFKGVCEPLWWPPGTLNPSLMYVCLQRPPLKRTLAPKRGQIVSWTPLLRVPKHAMPVLPWLLTGGHGAARVRWWGDRSSMGGPLRVLSDWLIGGVVYIVYLCPAWRNSPPPACSLSARHTMIAYAWKSLVTMQTSRLCRTHFPGRSAEIPTGWQM